MNAIRVFWAYTWRIFVVMMVKRPWFTALALFCAYELAKDFIIDIIRAVRR